MRRAAERRTKRAQAAQRRQSPQPGHGLLVGILGGALLLLAGLYLWLLGGPVPGDAAVGGSWTLMRADGKLATDRDFRGRTLLIYFGYTSCPDVCPVVLGTVADAMQRLGDRARTLQPLFITVDPSRDTPDAVQHFVQKFDPRLIGLTGSNAQIQTAMREYQVTAISHPDPAHRGQYTLDHSSVLLLVGPDGRYLAPLPADETAAELAGRLLPYL